MNLKFRLAFSTFLRAPLSISHRRFKSYPTPGSLLVMAMDIKHILSISIRTDLLLPRRDVYPFTAVRIRKSE